MGDSQESQGCHNGALAEADNSCISYACWFVYNKKGIHIRKGPAPRRMLLLTVASIVAANDDPNMLTKCVPTRSSFESSELLRVKFFGSLYLDRDILTLSYFVDHRGGGRNTLLILVFSQSSKQGFTNYKLLFFLFWTEFESSGVDVFF